MKGLSPLVGFALTILLITISVTVVITTIIPAFERLSDSNVIDEGVRNLQLLDTAIRQVAAEAEGSKRTITIRFSEGRLRIDANKELIKFEYDMKTDLSIEGLLEGVFVDKLPYYVNYFNYYSDGSVPSDINCDGSCVVEGSQLALRGFAWKNLGFIKNFRLEAKIVNESGIAEAFFVPGSFDDLVLYLPFDEGQGNVSYDYSKYRNNGTLYNGSVVCSDPPTSGCPKWVGGKVGYGIEFDGVDDFINISGDRLRTTWDELTIMFWVKTNSGCHIVGGTGICMGIFDNYNNSGINSYFRVYITNGDGVGFALRDDTNTESNAAVNLYNLTDNNWHFIAITRSGGTITFYVDGNVGITQTVSSTSTITINNPSSWISIATLVGLAKNFTGIIDEFMIFNRSLTDNEVKALYQLTLQKLISSGTTDVVRENVNATLVLASPTGKNYFDNVKVKGIINRLVLTIPYSRVDISEPLSIGPGNTIVSVEKIGFNETSGKPIIKISTS